MAKRRRRKGARRGSTDAGAAHRSPAPTPDDQTEAQPRPAPKARAAARPHAAGGRRSSTWRWVAGVGAVALLIGAAVAMNVLREAALPGERFRSQGNVHVAVGTQTPPYNSEPPTSGWHAPQIAAWGAYEDDAPHDHLLLHNMEDGGVVLWYAAGTPDENAAHVRALQDVLGSRWPRTVIVPREGLETPYVLTAWTRLQRFDGIDAEGMRAFVSAYHGIDNH